jgi:CRP-like cAMP-binding protein
MAQYDMSFLHNEPNSQTFKAFQMIFKEGDAGDFMYGVISGEIDILIGGQVVEVVEANSIFGEMALIDDSPRSASAVAKTDCKLAVIDQRRFKALIQQKPFFAIQVMGVLADRLRRTASLLKTK